jgi:hypothetical protein
MWPLWSGRKSGERTGLGLFLEYRWIMVVVGMFSHLNMCLSLFFGGEAMDHTKTGRSPVLVWKVHKPPKYRIVL